MRLSTIIILLSIYIVSNCQAQKGSILALNNYTDIVIKAKNKHFSQNEIVESLIRDKLIKSGFLNPLESYVLQTEKGQDCNLITCVFNVTKSNSLSVEIETQLTFIDCNYNIIFKHSFKHHYSSFNKKNIIKNVNSTLSIFNNYQYSYNKPNIISQASDIKKEPTTTLTNKIVFTSDIDINIPKNPKSNKKLALIFGNEDYTSFQAGLSNEVNVPYAINDANIFKQYCTKTLGVEDRNVFYFENATAAIMKQNIDLVAKLLNRMGENSILYFYYAGHGLPDEVTKEPYIMPVDVHAGNLPMAINLNELYKLFGNINCKIAYVFLDACFSGGGRNSGLLSARGVKINPKTNPIQGNLAVFSATTQNQSALPLNSQQHGLFTYFLLKKIQESKGKVNLESLFNNIYLNVTIESLRENKKDQEPKLIISPSLNDTWKKISIY